MSNENLIQQMKQKLQYAPALNARILFDLGDDGFVYLDGRETPPVVEEKEDRDVETTLTMTKANLTSLVNGTLDPTMAFMTGKLKVSGKMGYAMKLSSLLED